MLVSNCVRGAQVARKEKMILNQSELPKPGDVLVQDFRPNKKPPREGHPELQVLQWNIERGYELDAIKKEIKRLDPDIIAVQEIDIGCARSGGRDVGVEIAKELGMNYVFVCEFEELHSPLRSERDQGGGVHGNGILTKFDFKEVYAVEHTHHPINWESPKLNRCKREPRRGERLSLGAVIDTPDGPLVCYCCHLEVFCGIVGRISQFVDILRDSKRMRANGYQNQLILGDLNTMASGLARFAPAYCNDHLRFRTMGIKEARFWQDNLLSVMEDDLTSKCSDGQELINEKLLGWGVDMELCKEAINPGFVDPWDVDKDVTLEHPLVKGWKVYLLTAKLDWVLGRRVNFLRKEIGNHDYRMSDHKWLWVEIKLGQ